MNRRLQALRAEHDRVRSAMDTIENTAVDEARDLTDEEATQLDTLSKSQEDLARSITEVVEREDRVRATADILSKFADEPTLTRGNVHREPSLTPGEYAALCIRAFTAGNPDPEALDTLTRALQHETTTDTGGLLPVPIFGDLIKFVDANRYAVNVMRNLPMPEKGKTFTRPRATQATQVGAQANEGDVLASRKFLVTGDTVTKTTQGGTLSLSEQDLDWTDPALLDLVVQDLAEQYAIDTETISTAAIEAAVTTNNTDTERTGMTAAQFFAACGTGAGALYGTAKALPDIVFASVDQWAMLIGLTDTTGRQVFPSLSPVNAAGTLEIGSFQGNPLGVRLCVSPSFSAGFLALGVSKYLEVFERNKGQISLPSPSTLEVNVAYRGYFATHIRAEGLWGLKDLD